MSPDLKLVGALCALDEVNDFLLEVSLKEREEFIFNLKKEFPATWEFFIETAKAELLK